MCRAASGTTREQALKFNFLPRSAIKTRATLFTLVVFVFSLWALSFYASHMIKVDMQRMWLATLLLTLLAGALTWWMLHRELSPLRDATQTLASLAASGQLTGPLPVARQDEVGALIDSFNRLLTLNQERLAALQISEQAAQARAHELSLSEDRLNKIGRAHV